MGGVYLFCLIVGGGLTGISLFGDLFGGDVDVDTDFDTDSDIDLDADADADVDAVKLLSFKSLLYGLLGFGLTGTLLSRFPTAAAALTLAVSLLTGVMARSASVRRRRTRQGSTREGQGRRRSRRRADRGSR